MGPQVPLLVQWGSPKGMGSLSLVRSTVGSSQGIEAEVEVEVATAVAMAVAVAVVEATSRGLALGPPARLDPLLPPLGSSPVAAAATTMAMD